MSLTIGASKVKASRRGAGVNAAAYTATPHTQLRGPHLPVSQASAASVLPEIQTDPSSSSVITYGSSSPPGPVFTLLF